MNVREYRAAGGVVLDDQGRVLVIERWVVRNGEDQFEVRLPKGHVEPGETDEQAALRETCEETGYCHLELIADLGEAVSEFAWPDRDERVRRIEHYYLMRLADPARGEPQFDHPNADEAGFTPRWAAGLTEAQAQLTFPTEIVFAHRAAEWVAEEGAEV